MADAKWVSRQGLAAAGVVTGRQGVVPWTYYDTNDIANGNSSTTQEFFINEKGSQGEAITNLENKNILQSGKQMYLSAVDLDLWNNAGLVAGSLADLQKIVGVKSSYKFEVNGKVMLQGGLSDLCGGSLYGFGTPGTYNQYAASRRVVRTALDGAILIPTATTFTFTVTWAAAPNPAVAVTMRINFRGQLVRLGTQ
ncbi:MAG: hypothetical protein KGO96_13765 [Elusimicrobia bacterium]|nr:hypothetical protein [Elusimicrobiota bacterium]MDE2236272.1 hypothetical protein [Elusimicrobiota bacterium]MDE2426962.1 hypothetical protein [Elusimicrobiota bacterium]